jgi:glycosyltransferase involved in cell wall biosynthesis
MIEQKGLSDRVVFAATWITEDRKADLLADCLAAAYVPFDEDSYGYPSIEAHHAKKGVVTCKDSGGTLELVTHKDNGLVVEPEPESLAIAFDQLYSDRKLARSLGLRGHERLQELGINWDRVVEVFTS